jgi:hypothetical protein
MVRSVSIAHERVVVDVTGEYLLMGASVVDGVARVGAVDDWRDGPGGPPLTGT